MLKSNCTVIVVEDDPEVRGALKHLLKSIDLDARLYGSALEFLQADLPDGPACIVLDIRLPGKSGLACQRELAAADIQIPIIFITGHGDIQIAVQAMKAGAIEFLTKPFRDQDLIDAIQRGIAFDRARHEGQRALDTLKASFQSLTPREREVMSHLVQGRRSKQIADEFGIAEATLRVHRSKLMQKMNVSLLDLGKVAAKLNAVSEKE
jgi:FixJ family two-component response regulator